MGMERARRFLFNLFTMFAELSAKLLTTHPDQFRYQVALASHNLEPYPLAELEEAEQSITRIESTVTPISCETIRIGSLGDGGYQIVDFLQSRQVISCGLARNLDFELDMIERGSKVLAFDPTVPQISTIENFRHVRKWIARKNSRSIWSLRELVSEFEIPDSVTVKLDIEGSEWEFLERSLDDLQFVDILIVEFHDFRLLSDPEFRARAVNVLERLNNDFVSISCEANNYSSVVNFGLGFIPDVMQVSFLSRKHIFKLTLLETKIDSGYPIQNNPFSLPIPNLPFTARRN